MLGHSAPSGPDSNHKSRRLAWSSSCNASIPGKTRKRPFINWTIGIIAEELNFRLSTVLSHTAGGCGFCLSWSRSVKQQAAQSANTVPQRNLIVPQPPQPSKGNEDCIRSRGSLCSILLWKFRHDFVSRWQLQPLSLLAARTEAAAVQCLRSSPENNRSSLPLLFWHCLASDCSKQCRAAHVRLTWKVHHASESPTCLARQQMAAEGLKSRQWKHMKTAGDRKTWKSAKSYVSPGFLR